MSLPKPLARGRWLLPTLLGAGTLLTLAVPARSSDPSGVSARAYQRAVGGPSGIRVSWNRPKSIPSSLILGYVLWRRDELGAFQLVGGVDTDASHEFLDVTSTRSTFAYDGAPGQNSGSRTQFVNIPGVVLGRQYRYQVSAAARGGLLDRNFDGIPDGVDVMTTLSAPSGSVTAVGPPTITEVDGQAVNGEDAVQVGQSAFRLEWNQAAGADTYVVWLSTDPRFPAGNRYSTKPFRTAPVDRGGPETVSRQIRIPKGKLRRARRLFVAVGGRNSGDRLKPAPFGAIFGTPVKLQLVVLPPDPPGS